MRSVGNVSLATCRDATSEITERVVPGKNVAAVVLCCSREVLYRSNISP
jgi:hypothetical protein